MTRPKRTWRSSGARMENNPKRRFLSLAENTLAGLALFLLALLPVLEILSRKILKTGLYSSSDYIQHLVLWITFIGGMVTSREGKHLSLSAGIDIVKEPFRTWIRSGTSFVTIVVSSAFMLCALSFALIGFEAGQKVGFIPVQAVLLIMPLSYAVMCFYFIRQAPLRRFKGLFTLLALLLGLLAGFEPFINITRRLYLFLGGPDALLEKFNELSGLVSGFVAPVMKAATWPVIILLILSALAGTPIFIILGGLGLFFFLKSGGSIEVVSNEAYTMLTEPSIPALPLFTLAGFLLSESKASQRLVKLFQALLGWLPGGLAVVTVLICAFFTTFTGASGVTILALGGLLSVILISNKYPEKFSHGLLTASGSIGLLFPPSLPVIMYGVIAQINIKHVFIAGVLPGLLMIITLIIMGMRTGMKKETLRIPFQIRNVFGPLKEALGEILLPLIITLGYFMGFFTLVETGAIAVLYTLVLEMIIHRDIRPADLFRILQKSTVLIGGVLIILAGAKALSYFIVDAEIPTRLVELCQAAIRSKYLFLILLNIALLIVGCFMDIFSAIIVVVPLILPLGRAYGIDPIHLGIIFLANLELGYLTPPVGLNLYLASYTFEKPLGRIYRNIIPFLLVLLLNVLLITYLPGLTSLLLNWIK